MIKIGFTKDPDNYDFDDNKRFELIFLDTDKETGFFIALTNIKKKELDFYDYNNDTMIKDIGYQRKAYKYTLVKSWKFLYNDSILTKIFR